jgi:8-oxo-dGTP pyrophosphatase MutT (NUDIX family)
MDTATVHLKTAGLIVVKEDKLLLAFSKNKNAWYLPGGKVDAGETALQSIQREIEEELNVRIDLRFLKYYCHITAPAYGEERNVIMLQDCYWYELEQEISPGNEIGAVKYFDRYSYAQEAIQVAGVLKVFERLAADKIIR